jgi:hypothetical protein
MQNGSEEQKPGWTFKPDQPAGQAPTTEPATKQPTPQPSAPQQPTVQASPPPAPAPQQPAKDSQEISWTASEFISNHKSPSWYITLLAFVSVVAGLTYVFTGDYISTGTIVIVGVLFAILAGKQPRQLSYSLDTSGITIGGKFYPYEMFKSFTILEEGAIGCINLLPLKRFMPELSVYYPPEEEEKIINVLTGSLPNDQKPEQSFDKLMKKIRF